MMQSGATAAGQVKIVGSLKVVLAAFGFAAVPGSCHQSQRCLAKAERKGVAYCRRHPDRSRHNWNCCLPFLAY